MPRPAALKLGEFDQQQLLFSLPRLLFFFSSLPLDYYRLRILLYVRISHLSSSLPISLSISHLSLRSHPPQSRHWFSAQPPDWKSAQGPSCHNFFPHDHDANALLDLIFFSSSFSLDLLITSRYLFSFLSLSLFFLFFFFKPCSCLFRVEHCESPCHFTLLYNPIILYLWPQLTDSFLLNTSLVGLGFFFLETSSLSVSQRPSIFFRPHFVLGYFELSVHHWLPKVCCFHNDRHDPSSYQRQLPCATRVPRLLQPRCHERRRQLPARVLFYALECPRYRSEKWHRQR